MRLWKIKLQKIVRNFFDIKASKIVRERNGHLEIFSRPQVIENSRQYLLLRTDILQKTILGYPVSWKVILTFESVTIENELFHSLAVFSYVAACCFNIFIWNLNLFARWALCEVNWLWLRRRVVVFYAPVVCQARWCPIIFLWDNLVCQLGKIVPLFSIT